MEYYSVAELSQIAELNIQKIGLKVESSACTVIAQRSRGTPRIVNRLIRLVRDYAEFNDIGVVCPQVADQALNLYKIDQYGLDDMDRKILKVLQENYDGGPAGLESISTMVGEDKNTVEDYYEPFLLQSGFLIRTHRGRKLTGKGVNYLTKLA
jgi:Holliday junction DNA helicase RuvB